MKTEDCIKELKIHGMVEQTLSPDGEKRWVLTKKAVNLITECWVLVREKYPDASEEDITTRALIVVVLEKMGLVKRKNLTDYISAIKSLAADWRKP